MSDFLKLMLVKCGLLAISLFYGWTTILTLLFRWCRHGNAFWEVKERNLPPLCLQDASYGRHSTIKLKNIKLHYVENGDRNKPLMLFVHGFPEFWFTWRYQLKHFASTHWVVAFDMRGYGDSDKPTKKSQYKTELLEQDVYDLVKALNKDKCILVAHDWGGAICWNVATRFPEIIEKLIIINAPHKGAFGKKISTSISQFLKSWYIFLFQLPFIPELMLHNNDLNSFKMLLRSPDGKKTVSNEEIEAFKYTFAKKESWTPPLNYYRNALDAKSLLGSLTGGKGSELRIPKIQAPTLVIWGEEDLALDRELAALSAKFCEKSKIVYIPNGSHFVQQVAPEEVNKAIEDFIR